MGLGPQLALVASLVFLNAAFAGSEVALLSLREGQLRRLERRSHTGRVVATLARDPNRYLATVQIGITLAGFLASATAAVTLADPLVPAFGFLDGAARPAAVATVTVVLAFITLVAGELAPKRVAMQRAERWALLAARPLSGVAWIVRPLVWLLGVATDVTVRLMGGDPARTRTPVTSEEVRDLIATHDLYSTDQRRIILGALEVADRNLREILVPRTAVIAFADDVPAAQAAAHLLESGTSRVPVYRHELDDADRVVALLDLIRDGGTVADHANPAVALPESAGVVDALRQLQRERQKMALVISEHGGFEGIVTVEDLVEEVVGEIHDEHDRDVRDAVRRPDGGASVIGRFPVHDLMDLGIDVDGDHAVTVAGLITQRLGGIPVTGDTVDIDGWRFRVEAVSGPRIERVEIRSAD